MADISLTQAADSVRKLKGFTDAVTALGDFVNSVASVEQAALEASQRLSAKRDEEAQQDERLAKLADAIALAEADIKRSQAKALEVEQAAQRGASIIAARAKADAERLITEAQAEAERLKGPLNGELASITGKIANARSDLAGLETARDEAKATLEALHSQIADARAAIAKLLKV